MRVSTGPKLSMGSPTGSMMDNILYVSLSYIYIYIHTYTHIYRSTYVLREIKGCFIESIVSMSLMLKK